MPNPVDKKPFGTTADGHAVDAYTLTNSSGASATIITYGGIVTGLHVPDKAGTLGDVVLGFDNLQQYETQSPYFGALIGRVGNRIAKGKFSLDGHDYTLATNNGPNSLHGGDKGYDKRVWTASPVNSLDGPALRLTLTDPDGAEGYPGTVLVTVVYTLTNTNALRIDYTATTDAPTPINLTNHSYFNLKDAGATDMLGHLLQVNADTYTPVDDTLIPTGEIAPVKNTPIDFTQPKPIGRDLKAMGGNPAGYDHNLVLRSTTGTLALAATVTEPTTGRRMEVWTTQPGVQFYSGNFLDGTATGKHNARYNQYHAFCLETQHFPDAVHHPNFPSIILRPGQTYRQTTEYRFTTTP
jgi:aldose 1-epimerase